jgi:SAM-dependent methyltransferase
MPPLETQSALETLPPALRRPISAYARGEMPANIALMHLCMAAPDSASVDRAIAASAARDGTALTGLAALWRDTPGAFALVKQIMRTVDHEATAADPDGQLAIYAAAFDRAAGVSPEGSVALYSLGNPALLAAATREIACRLREWDLLGVGRAALEIGCGNGRFLEALAPELAHITGVDMSAAMVAAARERCRHLPNAEARRTDGRDLGFAADASLDLVLAVDSFPYVVRCGAELVRRHFEEAVRILRPGGSLLILNYAYDGGVEEHRTEIAGHAAATGFAILRSGTRDLSLWDGTTFLLQKRDA